MDQEGNTVQVELICPLFATTMNAEDDFRKLSYQYYYIMASGSFR